MELSAVIREGLGTGKAGKIRKNGGIPGVLYGEGKPPEHLKVNAQEVGRLMLKAGHGKMITLKLEKGKAAEEQAVLIKEIQRSPTKGNIIHIDFLRVALNHPVTVKVPVHLLNEEKRTKDGAVLEVLLHELEVSCLPNKIPEQIGIDVSKLALGSSIHVKDLKLDQGIKVLTPAAEMVVLAAAPNQAAEAPAANEEPTQPEVVKPKKEEA